MFDTAPEYIPEPEPNYVFWSHSSKATKEDAIKNTSEIFPNIPVEAILCTDYACKKPNGCKFTIFLAKEFAPDVDAMNAEIKLKLSLLKLLYPY